MSTDAKGKMKRSKRSQSSYSPEEWNAKRELITRLYFEEGKTLKEVRWILEQDHNFQPTERMYKSRLHLWGLDKKKKEHEMLEVIRIGFRRKDIDKDSVFQIRGRPVTLGDALHYFSRKGIKDPQSLLDQSPEPSSPSDADCQTPLDLLNHPVKSVESEDDDDDIEEIDLDVKRFDNDLMPVSAFRAASRSSAFAESCINDLWNSLQAAGLGFDIPVEANASESVIPRELSSPLEYKYMEAMLTQTRYHFTHIFNSRKLSVNNSTWSATSNDDLSDRFYIDMYHGYSYLWNGENDAAFENFDKAFGLIRSLLTEEHVGFLIYIFDLVIRYEGSGQQVLLLRLLQFLSEMARTVFSDNHPIRLIASWMMEANNIRSALAEFTLRRLLDFFQDSIGYFHQETIALLQTFAWALMNREQYGEAAAKFKLLQAAFETTDGRQSYEACYALRARAEAYFAQGAYSQSLKAVAEALERSQALPVPQEREIYVRCLRQMAEISKKLGNDEEAEATMQHCVDCCKETFGENHPFAVRAEMHQKSLRQDGSSQKSAIPPMVHRLGKPGNAAKSIWVSRDRSHTLTP